MIDESQIESMAWWALRDDNWRAASDARDAMLEVCERPIGPTIVPYGSTEAVACEGGPCMECEPCLIQLAALVESKYLDAYTKDMKRSEPFSSSEAQEG